MSYDASYPPPVEFFRIVLKSSFPLFVSLLCFVYSFGFVELKAQASSAPTRFTITDTQGLAKFPTFTKYEKTEILTIEEAEEIFKFIKENTNIEFKYSYGGCEKRAHAISLFLNEKKVRPFIYLLPLVKRLNITKYGILILVLFLFSINHKSLLFLVKLGLVQRLVGDIT